MNSISSGQSSGSWAAVRTALAPTTETRRTMAPARAPLQTPAARVTPNLKSDGYGLPCAKCRKYYSATLSACPVCQSSERVSPIAAIPTAPAAVTRNDGAVLDEERARLLREFKAKLYAAHTQISATNHACTYAKEGETAHECASVCKTCYERLQARVDLLEAALHMDLKEAAQVIYDAVWADTSDPNKTYQNAARALLGELRKRAGMKLILGRMQPLAH
jgi:hypothetical protein